MPFSIHLDEETRRAIEALVRKSGKPRDEFRFSSMP